MSPYTVLHVEDDGDDRLFLAAAVAKVAPDLRLRSVADGQEAVDYLSGTEAYEDRGGSPFPDLVLLDLKLPKKSGLEVLEWIRAREDLKGLTVFMLTSSSDPSDVERAHALGVNSYLIKSVGLEGTRALVRAIAEFARLARAQRPGPPAQVPAS